MNIEKLLPQFFFADERRSSDEIKFVVIEIAGHHFIAAEVMLVSHETIRKDVEKTLKEKGFRGEYKISGGGKLELNDEFIKAHDHSGSFGSFDKTTVEKILTEEFPAKKIIVQGLSLKVTPKSYKIA